MVGHWHDDIPEYLVSWIGQQKMFWVASAPLTADGMVNISPKGFEGTFHIMNANKVWYEDLSGSGVETISHIRENGRITVMFNAFEGPPRITRLYGKGTVYEFGTPEYNALLPPDTRQPGSRSAIVIDVYKVSTTCGYSVPFYAFKGHRTQLLEWAQRREAVDREAEIASPYKPPLPEGGMKWFWTQKNLMSLDGLRGLTVAHMTPHRFMPIGTVYKKDDHALPVVPAAMITLPDPNLIFAFLMGVLVTLLYAHV